MFEKNVDARTPDGVADCEFYAPDESGQWPGVIMYPDVLGTRPAFRDMARRLVGEGFCVLMPNFYYRVSKVPVFSFTPSFGEEKTVARLGELRPKATPDLVARDVGPYVDTLLAQPQVRKGQVGTVGYCMTGSFAMRTAAAMTENVATAISFHGSKLYSDEPDSPHLMLPMIKAKLYFGFAVNDKTMPDDIVVKFKEALGAAGSNWDSDIYEGANHGWCMPDHPKHNEAQAERAWAKMVGLFKEALG
ncbi:MAG: dienelactone hydrolase family protein [Micropepsaceae bacterium]